MLPETVSDLPRVPPFCDVSEVQGAPHYIKRAITDFLQVAYLHFTCIQYHIHMERQHYPLGPEGLKQFLMDTDRAIVVEINAAVARLKSLGSELSQTPTEGDDKVQDTAKDTIDMIVRETNRRMRHINREVRNRTKGHREDAEIHQMINLLNDQIREAQSLMDRTVNEVRRRLGHLVQ